MKIIGYICYRSNDGLGWLNEDQLADAWEMHCANWDVLRVSDKGLDYYDNEFGWRPFATEKRNVYPAMPASFGSLVE